MAQLFPFQHQGAVVLGRAGASDELPLSAVPVQDELAATVAADGPDVAGSDGGHAAGPLALGLQAGEHLLHRVLGGRLIVNQQHGQPDQFDVMLPE